jgi:hypothetical protein
MRSFNFKSKSLLAVCMVFVFAIHANGQSADSIAAMQQKVLNAYNTISSKSLDFINDKYTGITGLLQKQMEKFLAKMQAKEAKLMQKVQSKDSVTAKQLFTGVQKKYQQLSNGIESPLTANTPQVLKVYIPNLDSMQTAMHFLQQANSKIKGILSASKLQQIQAISVQIQALESRLQQANKIQTFIAEREAQLKAQLANFGLGKQLMAINKQAYYYQAQIQEYKNLLNDKSAMETKALGIAKEVPAFQKYMQKYGSLAKLFGISNGESKFDSTKLVKGLQTRAQVTASISQKTGIIGGGTNTDPQQFIQKQVSNAQGALDQLKNKLNVLAKGGGTLTMPDFDPNTQKTKPFLSRLEYGLNIQSQRSSGYMPVTSSFAGTLGYKLSDKATVGTGIAYTMGWGNQGIKHIQLSNQGVGLRSFIDIKAKKSIWVTGGFEYNYLSEFAGFDILRNLTLWKRSALLGLTKKYKIGKKEGNMQLLYDFLSDTEIPQTPAFRFRVGWTF